MILIRSVDWIEIDGNYVKLTQIKTPPFSYLSERHSPDEKIKEELIWGRRFVRSSDGTDVVIGVSDEAGKVLGLQYEAWEKLEKELYQARTEHGIAKRELAKTRLELEGAIVRFYKIANENFWERLKRLFKMT